MPPFDQIAGPLGALVLAVAGLAAFARVIVVLWNDHRAADDRERARYLSAEDRLDRALTGLKEHTDVSDRAVALAEAAIARLEREREKNGGGR